MRPEQPETTGGCRHGYVRRTMAHADAIRAIQQRASSRRETAAARWAAATGIEASARWAAGLRAAGRLTVNFHPDRIGRDGRSVAEGLLATGTYHSQWLSGISSGSRSAVPGGERHRFERDYFAGAYDTTDPASGEHVVYGALDLTFDEHGGSPRFGSSFLVVRSHARTRTTLCVGDSHTAPQDVGTFDEPWSILAGLAEQAAGGDLLHRGLGVEALLVLLDGRIVLRSASRVLDGYVEAQFHGGLDLSDDVEAIVLDPSFRHTDVEHALAAAADRHGFDLAWHAGSELDVSEVPADFRGPTMPSLALAVTRPGHILHARAIGAAALQHPYDEPTRVGDPPESPLQQLKYLWHTLLAYGHDAQP